MGVVVAFRLLGCSPDCNLQLQAPLPDFLFLVDVVRWFGPRLVSCFPYGFLAAPSASVLSRWFVAAVLSA
jgi:hypothetical protein